MVASGMVGSSLANNTGVDYRQRCRLGKKMLLRRACMIFIPFLGALRLLLESRGDSFSVHDKSNTFRVKVRAAHHMAVATNTTSPLNDKTLVWDSSVYRPWLDPNVLRSMTHQQPPAMILLTTHGWNQPNQSEGRRIHRSIRETELYNGIINHPWFHPTAWDTIRTNGHFVPKNIHYYIFFDLPSCTESNYPSYGGGTLDNLDTTWNRSTAEWVEVKFSTITNHYRYLLQDQVFLDGNSTNVTAVLFDCNSFGIAPNTRNDSVTGTKGLPISFATLSSLISNVDKRRDQGLAPPMPKPVLLSEQEENDIATCRAEETRTFHAVYIGNKRSGRGNREFHRKYMGARGAYFPLHDNNRAFFLRHSKPEFNESALANYTYEDILKRTSFGVAPRGDNKFTYRFSEVMSAGSIPVVHADDWVWPFRPELIDWNECAVILPERDAGAFAMAILDNMTTAEKCRRRQRCYDIYKKYMKTTRGTISGLIEGLELVAAAQGRHMPMVGIRCREGDPDCNMKR